MGMNEALLTLIVIASAFQSGCKLELLCRTDYGKLTSKNDLFSARIIEPST
jgi:hypothetical protein